MPDFLSDAEVFGGAPTAKPKAPVASASAPAMLSDADVFGEGKPTNSSTASASVQAKPKVDGSLKDAVRSGISIVDLFTTGAVQGIADVFAQTTGRVIAGLQGASRKDSIKFGKEFGQMISDHPAIERPLSKLFNWAVGEAPEGSTVDQVMGEVTKILHKGAKRASKLTGGALKTEDFELLFEALTAGGGSHLVRRVMPGGRPKIAPPKTPLAETPKVETPAARAAKHDVKTDIEMTTGVNRLDPKAAQKVQAQRRAEVRAAFKEDPQYADYLKNYAEEEARQRASRPAEISAPGGLEQTGPRAERTGLREAAREKELPPTNTPKIETGGQNSLDSALAKVRQGRSFDLTAEERIQLRKGEESPKIETTVGRQPKVDPRQRGSASTADTAALAAFVGGIAAAHAYQDDPSLPRDLLAGILASAATRIRPRAVADSLRAMRSAKPLESVSAAITERDRNIRLAGIDATNTVRKVAKLVPDDAGREKVHVALDTGDTKLLSPSEREAFGILREEYNKLGAVGLSTGVLKDAQANYATHMWKMDAGTFEQLFKGVKRSPGTSPNTPYSMHRQFRTMAEGEKAGLVAASKDAAFVFGTYAHSLASAVQNARLLETLKAQKTAGGDSLLAKASDAPRGYQHIDSPQLQGLAVHPDVAEQIKFVYENPTAAGVVSAIETIADVSKRSAVSASFFHAKALADVLVAAVPGKAEYFGKAAVGAALGYGAAKLVDPDHPGVGAALGGLAGFVGPRLKAYATGRTEFLKELEKGSSSPFITRAVKSGLVFGNEKGALVVDDAGRKFYDAMQVVQREADRLFSPVGIKAGKGVEAYIKANHWMDDMMWGRLHPAMKLETWSKQSEILRMNSIERNAKDGGKSRILSEAEADEIAARYTNDLFGGLDWAGIAMNASTRIGRLIGQQLLSPKGRRWMRIAMFAPDWTISTTRSALAAIDKDLVNPLKWGRVVNGLYEPITRGDLARQYIARSALYYLVVGDAINYSRSGHHLWQNDDKIGWSYIDWGDGRKMQFSKHIMEVPHWVERPKQQALGKLGYVVKEPLNQAFGTEYLAPHTSPKSGAVVAGPKMKDPSALGRTEHALRGFVPIPFQGDQDLPTRAWGEFGMPIYGKTSEQKEEERLKRREKRRRKYE